MPRPALSSRDDELLDTLTLRVRMLTLEQAARTWWPSSAHARRAARRRLRELEAAGLVRLFELAAHPELPLLAPVFQWRPREPRPDLHKMAYALAVRWTQAPPVRHTAVIATRDAGRHYGGWGGRFPRPTERTHDLHMAAVYLLKRAANPAAAAHWCSEEKLRETRGGKPDGERRHLPDAVVTRPKRTAIEFGGAYRVDKLQSFHDYCEGVGLPYEMW